MVPRQTRMLPFLPVPYLRNRRWKTSLEEWFKALGSHSELKISTSICTALLQHMLWWFKNAVGEVTSSLSTKLSTPIPYKPFDCADVTERSDDTQAACRPDDSREDIQGFILHSIIRLKNMSTKKYFYYWVI